jgi:peptide/nickel transport system substrate-binding protein
MGNRRRRTCVRGTLVALGIGLAGCSVGGDDHDGPRSSGQGGTLVYLASQPIENLDPQRIYAGRDNTNLGRTVYRSLVSYPISQDPSVGTTPVPDLATDTGRSRNGGRVWSFTIKDDVTWEDGRAITCQDFRYGASRAFASDVIAGGPSYLLRYLDIPVDPATQLSAYTGPYTRTGQELFDRAVTCEGSTITYRFNKPWPDFALAIAALHMADPYREDKDHGDRSRYQIFSNGPYRLDGRWDKAKGGSLVRNQSYEPSTDSPDLRRALPDRIEFRVGATVETQYDRLIADNGDDRYAVTGDSAPPVAYSKIAGAVADRSVLVDSPYVHYLAPHFRSSTMKNPTLRKALMVSTNTVAYNAAQGGKNAGSAAESVVHPSVPGYQPNPAFAGPSSGDPEAARRLLIGAGVKLPVQITFTYSSNKTSDKSAAALKDTWDRSGFDVTLDPEVGSAYNDVIANPYKDVDVMLLTWGADWPSAITVTPPLFDSRANLTASSDGQDNGAYASAAFNELVDEAQTATTLHTQRDALRRGDLQLGEDIAYIPLSAARFLLLHGSKVTNYAVTPASGGYPDLGGLGVAV